MIAARFTPPLLPRHIHRLLPWILIAVVSVGLAQAMNSAVLRALSTSGEIRTDMASTTRTKSPCDMDADGVLYAGLTDWVPAGRSAFCKSQILPGVYGRAALEEHLGNAGELVATVTFPPPDGQLPRVTRVDIFCTRGFREFTINQDLVSAAEALTLYAEVCRANAAA